MTGSSKQIFHTAAFSLSCRHRNAKTRPDNRANILRHKKMSNAKGHTCMLESQLKHFLFLHTGTLSTAMIVTTIVIFVVLVTICHATESCEDRTTEAFCSDWSVYCDKFSLIREVWCRKTCNNCDSCAEGWFGHEENCVRCMCNLLGTNVSAGACNRTSGQCACLPNVEGWACDMCARNHWGISSGRGCISCDCDPDGVRLRFDGQPDLECNVMDGSCSCRAGRGGRRCNECEVYHWGDPLLGSCTLCDCYVDGVLSMQCDRVTGLCECNEHHCGAHCQLIRPIEDCDAKRP